LKTHLTEKLHAREKDNKSERGCKKRGFLQSHKYEVPKQNKGRKEAPRGEDNTNGSISKRKKWVTRMQRHSSLQTNNKKKGGGGNDKLLVTIELQAKRGKS